MARSIVNFELQTCEDSVVKLQALIRGHLIRKQFLKVRDEYDNLVKKLECKEHFVTWRSEKKPCLPTVCEENKNNTISNCSVNYSKVSSPEVATRILEVDCLDLKDHSNEHIAVGFEHRETHANCSKVTSPGVAARIPEVDSKQLKSDISDGFGFRKTHHVNLNPPSLIPDLESSDVICPTGHDQGSSNNGLCESGENSADVIRMHLNELSETEQVIDEARQTGIQSLFGIPISSYPKEKVALLKLREDLSMELLWIQQAIDSRKKYLVMKQNLFQE